VAVSMATASKVIATDANPKYSLKYIVSGNLCSFPLFKSLAKLYKDDILASTCSKVLVNMEIYGEDFIPPSQALIIPPNDTTSISTYCLTVVELQLRSLTFCALMELTNDPYVSQLVGPSSIRIPFP